MPTPNTFANVSTSFLVKDKRTKCSATPPERHHERKFKIGPKRLASCAGGFAPGCGPAGGTACFAFVAMWGLSTICFVGTLASNTVTTCMHRVCSCPKALGLWAAAPQQLLGACAHGGPLVCAWHAISGVWVLLKSIIWAWLGAVVP